MTETMTPFNSGAHRTRPMRHPLVFSTAWCLPLSLAVPLLVASTQALAQSVADPNTRGGSALQELQKKEQRRTDLRSALQSQRQNTNEVVDKPPSNRHLTPEEMAEMRKQLRQQRQN